MPRLRTVLAAACGAALLTPAAAMAALGEIADALFVAETTVKCHVGRILAQARHDRDPS